MTEYKPHQVYEDRNGDRWRVNDEGLLCLWVAGKWYEGPDGAPPEEIEGDLGPLKLINDPVNRPAHYTAHPSGVECIQITEHMNFCLGNAVKYIWRAGLKSDDPIEDLNKAKFYIEREVKRLEKGGDHF